MTRDKKKKRGPFLLRFQLNKKGGKERNTHTKKNEAVCVRPSLSVE